MTNLNTKRTLARHSIIKGQTFGQPTGTSGSGYHLLRVAHRIKLPAHRSSVATHRASVALADSLEHSSRSFCGCHSAVWGTHRSSVGRAKSPVSSHQTVCACHRPSVGTLRPSGGSHRPSVGAHDRLRGGQNPLFTAENAFLNDIKSTAMVDYRPLFNSQTNPINYV